MRWFRICSFAAQAGLGAAFRAKPGTPRQHERKKTPRRLRHKVAPLMPGDIWMVEKMGVPLEGP